MTKKIKLVTVVGTRPELIRLALTIKKCDQFFEHILVHTGQNYDYELNQIFFDDLGIRKPDHFLNVPSNSLGGTLGNVIAYSYDLFQTISPEAILVLGDTNSALCIYSAKRLKIPIFHMEAGNRCFDLNVPEEINRKIADHLADINLPYTENSRRYLLAEGIRKDHIFVTGSPMFETLSAFKESIDSRQTLKSLNLKKGQYILASIHREENLDLKNNFEHILNTFVKVSEQYQRKIIFSTHPRTRKKLEEVNFKLDKNIEFMNPVGFFDYINLQQNAYITLSDSGTLSEEAGILNFPAVSIRTTTERPEAIDFGSVVLGNIETKSILQSIAIALEQNKSKVLSLPPEYQVTNTSSRVVRVIQGFTSVINKEIWGKNP